MHLQIVWSEILKMAKQISQETFDTAVKENIEDFEMTPQEALDDAVSQFEAQVSS